MPPLAALLLATPVFGLALDVDPAFLSQPSAAPSASIGVPLAVSAPFALDESTVGVADRARGSGSNMAEQIERRQRIGRVHRAFGIATWAGMTAATVFGIIQYRNLYGAFASLEDTPCVRGTATFGQSSCSGLPAPHLATVMVTTALYYTTFGLSYAMPDPLHASEGDGDLARRLRTHKRLRWVHFAGMAAQILLGFFVANSDRFGITRAENYRALQGLATAHLAIGLATWGTLTYAGALMIK